MTFQAGQSKTCTGAGPVAAPSTQVLGRNSPASVKLQTSERSCLLFSLILEKPGNHALNFSRPRKTPEFVFREKHPIVGFDVENASRASLEFNRDSESSFNLIRQTGGPRQVVSNTAIGDAEFHRCPPLLNDNVEKPRNISPYSHNIKAHNR